MSSEGAAPTDYQPASSHAQTRIAIVTAQWHGDVVEKLHDYALARLIQLGVGEDRIERFSVPGSFEIPLAVRWALGRFDAVLCFGCVVRGETSHNEYINHAVCGALQSLMLATGKPVLNGVLTTETLDQAHARAGGPKGDKGAECAVAALQMIDLQRALAVKDRPPVGLRVD